ncbi:hypothetical protein P5Y53_04580 [Dyella jiangningensis]|uniref:hypothetical protein n=1 Tax=Dyella jiangningensis TaxID=1379159 RepID=UPI00240F31D3|nr:hypothetical protein [Dyella jiangningensis]MDG2536929.1 hypothetical protein [Dyella jiangningensis]
MAIQTPTFRTEIVPVIRPSLYRLRESGAMHRRSLGCPIVGQRCKPVVMHRLRLHANEWGHALVLRHPVSLFLALRPVVSPGNSRPPTLASRNANTIAIEDVDQAA